MLNQTEAILCTNLGAMMQILLSTDRRMFKLASICAQTVTALRLNQVTFVHNERGEAVGYALYAFVSDEVARALSQDPNRLLHASEWNEGLNLWIMDFVVPPGHAPILAARLRNEVLKDFERVRGVRTRKDGSIRKIVDARIRRPVQQGSATSLSARTGASDIAA